jgi:transmembrane sensor
MISDELLLRTLSGRADPAELEEVREWRGTEEANELRYQAMARLLELARRGERGRERGDPPSARSIIAAAEEEAEGALAAAPLDAPLRGVRWLAVAAALVLCALGGAVLRDLFAAPAFGVRELVGGSAGQSTVVLRDGSVVRLAAGSRLQVPGDGSRREVTVDGRAYFSVTHDAAHPFVVRAAGGEVRVLGTRFELDATGDDLRVFVVQGRVALKPQAGSRDVELTTGQVGTVAAGAAAVVSSARDSAALTGWMGDFLAFQNTPLTDALAEVEKMYHVSTVVTDPALAHRTVTAWFSGWKLDAVAGVLCTVVDADCVLTDSTLVVSPRRSPSGSQQRSQ